MKRITVRALWGIHTLIAGVSHLLAGDICVPEEISGVVTDSVGGGAQRIFEADGVAYFLARNGDGNSMYIVDGSSSVKEVNLPPGSRDFDPGGSVAVLGDSLYFGYYASDAIGNELHRMDPGGRVELIADLDTHPPSPFGSDGNGFRGSLVSDGERLFFEGTTDASSLSSSNNVYVTSGATATMFGPDLNDPETVGPLGVGDLFALSGAAYITGRRTSSDPVELWRGDGSGWTSFATLSSFNITFWELGDSIAFFGMDGAIWRTDGSAGGTFKVTPEGTELSLSSTGTRRDVFGDTLIVNSTGGLWHSNGGRGDAKIVLASEEGSSGIFKAIGNRAIVYFDPSESGVPNEVMVVEPSGATSTLEEYIGLPDDTFGSPPTSPFSATPPAETSLGGMVFIASGDLWLTDFSPGGTYRICDQNLTGSPYAVVGNYVITIRRRASNRNEYAFARIPIQRLDGTPTPTPTVTPTPTPVMTTSGPPPGPFNIISPGGRTIVEGETTTFMWESSENAATYRVLIISPVPGMGGQSVFSSDEVEGTSLTVGSLPSTLHLDRPYTWMVEAKSINGQTRDSNNELQFFQERADAAGLRTLLDILTEGMDAEEDQNGDGRFDAADIIMVIGGLGPVIR